MIKYTDFFVLVSLFSDAFKIWLKPGGIENNTYVPLSVHISEVRELKYYFFHGVFTGF